MSTRFLSLTPLAAALLMPLGASAITTLTVSAPLCGGEAMPEIEARYKMVCALDQGVSVDSPQDQSANVIAALGRLSPSATGLFFPSGRYLLSQELQLRTGNVLVGSRIGETRFVNPASATSQITQDSSPRAKNILIDHLVLDNITVQMFQKDGATVPMRPADGATIRDNTFLNTHTDDPQIRVDGAAVVTGNVLLRKAAHPGIGIELSGAYKAQVVGNWIGENRAPRDARGASGWPTTSDAFFTHALLSRAPMLEVQIRDNDVALTLEHAPVDHRYLALLSGADDLTLDGNQFRVINGSDDLQQPAVVLRSPQNTTVVGNSFLAVPLHLTPSDGTTPRPTKRTRVTANLFVEATVDTTQTTMGWDESGTTPDDLLFTGNRFAGGEPDCMLRAPEPTISGMTYGQADNFMQVTGASARACYLRNRSIQEWEEHMPASFRGVEPPVSRADDVLLVGTTRTPRPTMTTTQPASLPPPPPAVDAATVEPLTPRVPVGATPSTTRSEADAAGVTPPAERATETWHGWFRARFDEWMAHINAMFNGR